MMTYHNTECLQVRGTIRRVSIRNTPMIALEACNTFHLTVKFTEIHWIERHQQLAHQFAKSKVFYHLTNKLLLWGQNKTSC